MGGIAYRKSVYGYYNTPEREQKTIWSTFAKQKSSVKHRKDKESDIKWRIVQELYETFSMTS